MSMTGMLKIVDKQRTLVSVGCLATLVTLNQRLGPTAYFLYYWSVLPILIFLTSESSDAPSQQVVLKWAVISILNCVTPKPVGCGILGRSIAPN